MLTVPNPPEFMLMGFIYRDAVAPFIRGVDIAYRGPPMGADPRPDPNAQDPSPNSTVCSPIRDALARQLHPKGCLSKSERIVRSSDLALRVIRRDPSWNDMK